MEDEEEREEGKVREMGRGRGDGGWGDRREGDEEELGERLKN